MNMTIKKTTKKPNCSLQKTNSSVKASGEYAEAREYIQCAISALGQSAQKSDILARESIANLSVVLMDLS